MYGIGLRTVHFTEILRDLPELDFFEAISENFMDSGGRPSFILDKIAERYPIVLHGVSMNIGTSDPLDFDYLRKLKALSGRVNARWISDHLCWTGVGGRNTHDLLPLPYNEETLHHVANRVLAVSDFLGQPLVLENASSYAEFTTSTMTEWQFLVGLIELTGCKLLLDVNNIYVSGYNHGFDPKTYIDAIPRGSVAQYHLAGHTNYGTHIIDTHIGPIIDEVWSLYAYTIEKLGDDPWTLIEWDAEIPDLATVVSEAARAREVAVQAVQPSAAPRDESASIHA
jgi:uncharacterized protein (UPF0276 family)